MIAWFINQIRQGFCKHTYEQVMQGKLCWDSEPYGYYKLYFCHKCGSKRKVEN